MSSYAHAQLWVEDWAKANKERRFRYLPGVEAYYHPDLEQWAHDKARDEQAKVDKKVAAKLAKEQERLQTKLVATVDADDETEEIEVSNALTLEDEEETKSSKHFNPVNRRHHLVILPKNQRGLLSLFAACSQAYLRGFFRFPRIDRAILKEAAKDRDLVVAGACIGGLPSYNVFQEVQQHRFDELSERLLDDPSLLERCVAAVGNCYDEMVDAVGEGNYYLELQFNRLPAQNLVNRAILEFARRNGVEQQLIVTGDAHYFRPELWKERELYKKLGFMNYRVISPDSLPKSVADLKCELYPKNAAQVWCEYQRSKEGTSFYDDAVIAAAVERTHDIAWQVIGEIPPDRSPKFPTKLLVPEGTPTFNHLVSLCKEGIRKRGLHERPEYIARLKEELGVIKEMRNEVYFISYQKIMELARKVCLVGPARGSGGGSLVAYVLYITDLDPIKWDLPFARFLSVYRKGAPDIDCVHEEHLVVMADGSTKRAGSIAAGDLVVGGDNKPHAITATYARELHPGELPVTLTVRAIEAGTLGLVVVVPGHKFIRADGEIVYADRLQVGDRLMATCDVEVVNVERAGIPGQYVDVTVAGDHRFHVVPFDALQDDAGRVSAAPLLYGLP